MRPPLFGELLGRLVQLSSHDVAEILVEQESTRRRFGEIALSFRLCEPRDVWRAWWEQISDVPERVDLMAMGIDAQSLVHLPRAKAEELGVIPVRATHGQMVLAASEATYANAAKRLSNWLGMQLKFVLADEAQIREAIESSYGRQQPAPAAA